ncbi:hypothetical protein [Microvirga sp. VF16]|uniref:hypothetical protein n=1 Tax=Microvirga sp. VF16 TaxID=2807101 RepID=UPI00193D82AB|nr:hypothetical protein [Microvirga sp. VF16]QRM28330.1 hypothetical protein JO965_19110 [Microvirga sp. VF16]
MPRTVSTRRRATQVDRTDCYPDDLLPELQMTLAALADVEIRYEAVCERQEHESPAVRQRFLMETEARFQREREPYIQRLEQLKHQIRCCILSGL